MNEKTTRALKWIVGILSKLEVPYRIGGGFAAHVYGSNRLINDIDISLPGIHPQFYGKCGQRTAT